MTIDTARACLVMLTVFATTIACAPDPPRAPGAPSEAPAAVTGDRTAAHTEPLGSEADSASPCTSDGTTCDDDDPCTLADRCLAGACVGVPKTCQTWGNDCLIGLGCDSATGQCRTSPFPDHTPCDDGNLCTTGDACHAGVCAPAGAAPCDDGNPCTSDGCTPKGGCVFAPNGPTPCDDGDACTAADLCAFGNCAGAPVSCDDGNSCTADTCTPAGGCSHLPDHSQCWDGDPCTFDVCHLAEGCTNPDGGSSKTLPLDLFLLQDLSGSFAEDLPVMNGIAADLVSAIAAAGYPSPQYGVGAFVDKPMSPFGTSEDYVYETLLPLTLESAGFVATIATLEVSGGSDGPESQLEALLQVAVRVNALGFRADARRVVVLTTDAPYHVAGDGATAGIGAANDLNEVLDGVPPGTGEDYPSVSDVATLLEGAGITPIFAVTKGEWATYQALVTQLGVGVVVELSADSANLVEAVLVGLSVLSCPGTCCEANTTPGCENPTVQKVVCAVEPACCLSVWSEGCVEVAQAEGACGG